MATPRSIWLFWVSALLVCSCQSKSSNKGAAKGAGGDVTDPYVAWLLGRGAEVEWPPEPIAGLLRAAGHGADSKLVVHGPNLMWDQTGLSVSWDMNVRPPKATCAEIGPAMDDHLAEQGFGAPPAGARKEVLYSAAGGIERMVSHKCADPSPGDPRCTGGSCARPTMVEIGFAAGLRMGGFAKLDDAFAPFPKVRAALDAALLPAFLAERLATARLHSVFCERWTGATCEWDLRFEVVPTGDQKQWILDTIELAKRYGFECDQTWRDPTREAISSTQACSGRNIWYRIKDGRVRLRLAAIVGAVPDGNPVECSAKQLAAHGSDPPAPADPGVQTILDVPVRKTAVAHMDLVGACYVEHQKKQGRTLTLSDWRRSGDFLQRTGGDRATRQDVTIGLQHRRSAMPVANGFFMRVRRRVRDDLSVEMYIRQTDFAKSWGGGHLEVKGTHGVNLFRVTLPSPDVGAPLATEESFVQAALAAVEAEHQRKLRGAGERQECRVLPNGGQTCDWVEITPVERVEETKRLKKERDDLAERVRKNRAELYGLAKELYPWSRADCALLMKTR